MVFFDTNILIDILEGRYIPDTLSGNKFCISSIVFIEVLSNPRYDSHDVATVEDFLDSCFEIFSLTPTISKNTAQIRRESGLKLGDAIIVATTLEHRSLLFTRDKEIEKKFPHIMAH